MQVASKELCEKLYELSGWTVTSNPESWHWIMDGQAYQHRIAPAYDLGWLMRKLSKHLSTKDLRLGYDNTGEGWWYAFYTDGDIGHFVNADTSEDAACKLLIKLVKQGISDAKTN